MNQKFRRIIRGDFNYSHIGQASAKQFSYLLDRRKKLKNILRGKKLNKIIGDDFIDQEEKDLYDDMYEKDEYEEDIFDKDYKNKYEQLLEEQKQKYFNFKKTCSFIIGNDQKEKIENQINNKKLVNQFDNDKYKYHLIHHHHDYSLDKALMNINGGQPTCTSYNPKMEYVYKKIIYTPQFKKMIGRYDQEKLKNKIEHQVEISMKHEKEKESKISLRKREKARASIEIEKKEKKDNLNNDNFERVDISKRHYSVMNKRKSSMISLFKKSPEKNDDNNEELINESHNFNKKLFKRTKTVIQRQPPLISFGLNNNKSFKNSFSNIKNIEESQNEEENYDYEEKVKHNISNNIDGNTLSSANYNKTTSGKKKDSSIYYNNNETDIIYPNNISKNDSNILISKNYSYKNEKNFLRNGDNKLTTNNNNSTSFNENNTSKKRLTVLNKSYKNIPNIITKSVLPSLNNNKVVNFDKMLSREYINKINERKVNIYSTITPNFESIRPKSIMKVMYEEKKIERKNKKKEFKSSFNEFVYDVNKNFNSYNNHSPPKVIYLDKISGREINNNSPLPSYMVNQYNRNAFNTFSDKSLEMNNYSLGKLKTLKSSFNDKKSFNYKLNDQYFDNDNNDEINSIMIKINNTLTTKYNKKKNLSSSNIISDKYDKYRKFEKGALLKPRISEYYRLNLDKMEKYPFSNGEKIDAFTLKTIKSNKSAINLLSDYEKRIFLSKLDS